MKLFLLTFTFTIVVAAVSVVECTKLDEVFAWQELDFAWPSESAKQDAVNSKRYIDKNNLPLGLDIWRDKLFITVPRLVFFSLLFLCAYNIWLYLYN